MKRYLEIDRRIQWEHLLIHLEKFSLGNNLYKKREILAIQYARLISRTPLSFPREFINEHRENYMEREIVILASTAAQVNYWARLIQVLGIPPAGFSEKCIVQNDVSK